MKHYFYFKKGQPVPWWFMPVWYHDTNEPADLATFECDGKVLMSDNGSYFMWPTSKYYRAMIRISNGKRSISSDFGGGTCTMLTQKKYRDKKSTTLANARRNGHDIHTTTKCLPIPEHFNRLKETA